MGAFCRGTTPPCDPLDEAGVIPFSRTITNGRLGRRAEQRVDAASNDGEYRVEDRMMTTARDEAFDADAQPQQLLALNHRLWEGIARALVGRWSQTKYFSGPPGRLL